MCFLWLLTAFLLLQSQQAASLLRARVQEKAQEAAILSEMTRGLKSLKAECAELTAPNNPLFTEVGELKLAVADREKRLTTAEEFANKQSESLKALESAKLQLELAAADRNRDFSPEASLI